MEIKYFGHSCFRLKGKEIVLAINPFDPSLGIKISGLMSDIVLFTDKKDSYLSPLIVKPVTRENLFVIDSPGEYEVGGVFILGVSTGKTTAYVVSMDDLRLVFLGDLKEKLSDKQIEDIIDGTDILFLPTGDSKQASEIINQIEPSIIIPMAYKLPGLKIDLPLLGDFLKEIGKEATAIEKLIISKDKLPLEKEVVVLNARS